MDSQNSNLFKQVSLRTDYVESFSKDFLGNYPMNLIHRIPAEKPPRHAQIMIDFSPHHGFESIDIQKPNLFKQVTLLTERTDSRRILMVR